MRRRERRGRKNSAADGLKRFRVKGTLPRNQFVEHDAKRKEIRTRVLRLAENLLGAPVGWCSRERRGGGIAAGQASHSKVHELHASIVSDQHVGGFDVAVNYALAVRGAESTGDFRDDGAGPGIRNAATVEDAVEWLAIQKLHDQIGRLRGLFDAHIVECDDGRMRELADDARFLEETLTGLASG